MRKEIILCDRCGRENEGYHEELDLYIDPGPELRSLLGNDIKIDLCPSCMAYLLKDFLTSRCDAEDRSTWYISHVRRGCKWIKNDKSAAVGG